MTPSLQPYPGYKHSGIPWLGDLPEHWEVRRGGWIFRKMDRPVRDVDEVVTCFRDGTVTLRKNRRTEGFTESLQEIGYQGVRKGDLVIHQMDAFAGAIGVSDSDGKGTPVYSVCYPTQHANPFYYALIVREMARSQWILALAKGIRERSTDFRYSEFSNQTLPLPPLFEQQAIVKYLNHADRRIRRYVTAKQKLIALLEEEKQAVVNRAVTCGLDPNVRLKPSGVEWLGDVPEHWEVRRVKSLSLVKRGASPRPIADPMYFEDDGEYAWVRILDVTASSHYLERTTQRLSRRGQSLSVELQPGALFLSIAGSVGKPIITKVKCCIHDGFVYFPQFRGNAEFLYRVFSCGAPFARLGKLGTQLNLNTDTVGSICLGWPALPEQAAIVEYLDKATAGIDAAIARARSQIELLEEYRTRLIADVVTGNLDVREVAAQLPEEPDDQDRIEGDSQLTEGMDKDLYDADASGEESAMESEVTA